MLKPWLQRAVQQKTESEGLDPAIDAFWRAVRRNAGMQIMTLNVVNAAQNVTGLSVALAKVKARHLRGALFEYMKHPKDTARMVSEKSDFMRETLDLETNWMLREINEIVSNPNAFQKIQEFAQNHSWVLQRMTQNPVGIVTWIGAYEQATEDGLPDPDAVREADKAVRLTQGAFDPEDIARYEAASPFVKTFTQFTGYFNMKANLMGTEFARTIRELGLKRGA